MDESLKLKEERKSQIKSLESLIRNPNTDVLIKIAAEKQLEDLGIKNLEKGGE